MWFPQARNYRVAIVETGTARGAPFIEPPARRCHSDITVVPVTRISATLQSAWDTQRGHSVRYPPCTRKKKEKLLRDSYSTCAGHSRKTRDERHSRKKKENARNATGNLPSPLPPSNEMNLNSALSRVTAIRHVRVVALRESSTNVYIYIYIYI